MAAPPATTMPDPSIQQIYKLDPHTLPDHGVFVFVGGTESGKTWLIRDILYNKRKKFDRGLIFSGSKETSVMYAQHIPSLFVYDGYNEDVLQKAFDAQECDVEMGKARPFLIILDDLMYDKKSIMNSPLIRRIFMNGRHAKCLVLVSMQYAKDINPNMRQQVKVVFICRENNPAYREKMFESFNLIFNNFREWNAVAKQCTQNYEVMVLIKTMSDQMSDNVFWYKAKEHSHFRVGKNGVWWRMHDHYYDPQFFMKQSATAVTARQSLTTDTTLRFQKVKSLKNSE